MPNRHAEVPVVVVVVAVALLAFVGLCSMVAFVCVNIWPELFLIPS